MENREQSRFLSVPAGIFQAICAYLIPNAIHVFLRQGKTTLSPRIMHGITGVFIGYRGKPAEDDGRDTIWAHRLRTVLVGGALGM